VFCAPPFVYLATEKILRPWSQQARQLTPRRGTVAHLGNRGCCVHIHMGNLSRYIRPLFSPQALWDADSFVQQMEEVLLAADSRGGVRAAVAKQREHRCLS